MTRIHFACAAFSICAFTVANPANADPRISSRAYVANEIITVRGSPKIESTIAFGADERIENIAVGDSAAWQVTPNKRANLLFVKPATARARSNMTVITDQRTYLFDLVSSTGASAMYMLRFSYPDAPKPMVQPAVSATAAAEVQAPPPVRAIPVQLNYGWRASGEKRILPASYFDDGASTFLRWSKEMTLPAILSRAPDGGEGPVNYTVQGEYVVVEGIPAQIILRSGKQVATLTPPPRPAAVAGVARRDVPRFETEAGRGEQ